MTPLQMALVAGARRERRQGDGAAPAQGGDVADGGTVVKVKPHALAARDEAADGRGAEPDDAGGRPVRHRHRAPQIPGVKVAGKTGTAETGQNRVYTAWFIFFAPADNPQIAGAVVLEHQLNGFGGAVCRPDRQAADGGDPARERRTVDRHCVMTTPTP